MIEVIVEVLAVQLVGQFRASEIFYIPADFDMKCRHCTARIPFHRFPVNDQHSVTGSQL